MTTTETTTDTLTAELRHNTWTVTDSEGGVWMPDEAAQIELEDAADPAARALHICRTAPMRGTWHY